VKVLTEKQAAKVEALKAPWMNDPLDIADLKAQRKEFEGSIKRIDKILAIIAPKKPRISKKDEA